MRLVRWAARPPVRWKNGGGVTTELLAARAGVDAAAFDWRISIAEVTSNGPFSIFPGVDRVLTILDGAGLVLTIGEDRTVLDQRSTPLFFAGDAEVRAELVDGPVRDLNILVRRGHFRADVRRASISAGEAIDVRPDVAGLLCLQDGSRISTSDGDMRLDRYDLLHFPHDEASRQATAVSGIEAILIGITGSEGETA